MTTAPTISPRITPPVSSRSTISQFGSGDDQQLLDVLAELRAEERRHDVGVRVA